MVDVNKARKNIDSRYEAKKRRSIELLNEAARDAAAIRQLIESKYRPRRIYQWSSLIHTERFIENSDIDFAVEGITDPETFFSIDSKRWHQILLDKMALEIPDFRPLPACLNKRAGGS